MTRIFLNGLGASAGGGLTYLTNVLPHLANAGVHTTVAAGRQFQSGLKADAIRFLPPFPDASPVKRFWIEQTQLQRSILDCGADVLISAGNFALKNSPVPQILLSRNSLYTCSYFFRDLLRRGEYGLWADTRLKAALAKRSVGWADRTVAPSASFAREIEQWTGRTVNVIHHGFDREIFCEDRSGPGKSLEAQLQSTRGSFRILLVSHYNYYRNFETVFRAIARLKESSALPVRLFLTCELTRRKTLGAYDPSAAAELIRTLGISSHVVQLGTVPYEKLHHLYRACDVMVTAAYTETFAHPLLEAMATDLPILASDIPVHREICRDAASYFSPFSPDELSLCLARIAAEPETRRRMAMRGHDRCRDFSWQEHVRQLVGLATELAERRKTGRELAASAA